MMPGRALRWRRSQCKPASVALTGPHRYVGGFQCRLHHAGQVIAAGVHVHSILEPSRERRHGGLAVISGPVEPPFCRTLLGVCSIGAGRGVKAQVIMLILSELSIGRCTGLYWSVRGCAGVEPDLCLTQTS